jgi:glycosyltransferase involved in cell wall biosynthesis
MSSSNDSISCLLPVKNGEKYLNNLIPVILSMLDDGDDFIIINDGSEDGSGRVIEEFTVFDSRIKLINTEGVGLVKALNLGIQTSQNGWIARFDVDDLYSDRRLAVQRKLIAEDVSVIFSDYKFKSRSGISLGVVYSALSPTACALALISGQRSAHPVALINRRLLLECEGYKVDDFPVEDLALWLRLSRIGKIVSTHNVLLDYQLSLGSISASSRKIQLSKKADLIRSYSFWPLLVEHSLTNFAQTVTLYKSNPNSSERLFLHIRDLLIARKFVDFNVKPSRLLADLGVFTSISLFFVGLKLLNWVLIRRIYRILRTKF